MDSVPADNKYVQRYEHQEFARRIDDEQHRQNKRISDLEENLRQMQSLTLSVERMAISMESMADEQKKQGERLEALEEVPKKSWDTLKYGILGAISTAIGGGVVLAIVNYL